MKLSIDREATLIFARSNGYDFEALKRNTCSFSDPASIFHTHAQSMSFRFILSGCMFMHIFHFFFTGLKERVLNIQILPVTEGAKLLLQIISRIKKCSLLFFSLNILLANHERLDILMCSIISSAFTNSSKDHIRILYNKLQLNCRQYRQFVLFEEKKNKSMIYLNRARSQDEPNRQFHYLFIVMMIID